jgi:hypothetical protein
MDSHQVGSESSEVLVYSSIYIVYKVYLGFTLIINVHGHLILIKFIYGDRPLKW